MVDPVQGADVPLAFAAGMISFLSPCVLPLVPGYLAAVSGVAVEDLERTSWRRVIWPSLAFIVAFSAVFIALGLTATGVGELLRSNRAALDKVAGSLIVLMGILFVVTSLVPRMSREWRVDALMRRAGSGGPIVAGLAFAFAWTPCVGPTLAGILTLASVQGSAGQGAFLLGIYSLGLAVPFLATALAFSQMTSALEVVKRHYGAIIATGGVILVVMGVLVYTGELFRLNIEAQRLLDDLGINFFNQI